MSLGLIGRKVGMTRVFNDDGSATAVTVIDVSNNRVSQVKTPANDGYAGVQLTFGDRRASRVTKPLAGHFAKAGVLSGASTREFRAEAGELKAGAVVNVSTPTTAPALSSPASARNSRVIAPDTTPALAKCPANGLVTREARRSPKVN